MNLITNTLIKLGILKSGLDYHLIRASTVVILMFFGHQKWFNFEAQFLIPSISKGPLISWMSPVFGVRGASHFFSVSEWLFGALLLAGYWSKKLGILGAIGSVISFSASITVMPLMSARWVASATGFPSMATSIAFPMKDLVLLAASIYLLRQDVMRVSLSATAAALESAFTDPGDPERLVVALQLWSRNNRRTFIVQKDL
jgi:uncharacterized membrane protein YkgB